MQVFGKSGMGGAVALSLILKTMNIHTKATNLTITPDIQDYLDKKMTSLDRLIDPNDTSVSCQVELSKTTNHHKSGDVFRAEINLRKDGKQFRAVSEQESIMAAMDEAKDEIVRELSSFKSKQMTMMRRGGAAIKSMMRGVGDFGSGIGENIGSIGSNLTGHITRRIKKWGKKGNQ